jgi:hypothetical protein
VLRTIRGAGAEDRVLRPNRADDLVARLVLPPVNEKGPRRSLSVLYQCVTLIGRACESVAHRPGEEHQRQASTARQGRCRRSSAAPASSAGLSRLGSGSKLLWRLRRSVRYPRSLTKVPERCNESRASTALVWRPDRATVPADAVLLAVVECL